MVVKHHVFRSMENFYQESGRAGRDDRPARCILQFRYLVPVLRIRILDLLDPDPLARGMDPESDPSIIKQK
jgi:superfamily II DNA helicase RecQ